MKTQLPQGIGDYQNGSEIDQRRPGERFWLDEFIERVARREGVRKPDAAFHARCVLEVVDEATMARGSARLLGLTQGCPEGFIAVCVSREQAGELSAAAFGRSDRGYQNSLIPERWMEAMWPNVRFVETTTTRHLSSGPRMARSTHLTASNAPFTSSLRDVSTVAARSSGTAKKSTAASSVVRTVHDMRQLDTAFATEALAKIAVFDWLPPALELARTDG